MSIYLLMILLFFFFVIILWTESRVFVTEKIYADVRIHARIEILSVITCH